MDHQSNSIVCAFHDIPLEILVLIAKHNTEAFKSLSMISRMFWDYSDNNMDYFKDWFKVKIIVRNFIENNFHQWYDEIYHKLPNGTLHGRCELHHFYNGLERMAIYRSGEIVESRKYSRFLYKHDYYVKGLREGFCRKLTFFGVREENNYFNGKKHGLCRKFYRSGEVFEESNYFNGKRHGLFRQFFSEINPDSVLCAHFTGSDPGIIKIYGLVHMECIYVNGVKQGLFKWYYRNGNLFLEGPYANDKRHGLFISYNYKNQFCEKIHYIKGTRFHV